MNPPKIFLLRTLALALALVSGSAANAQNPLGTLRSGHPRLFLLESELPAVKATIAEVEIPAGAGDAVLSLHGKKLRMHIASPSGVRLERFTPPAPPAPQAPVEGEEVIVHLPPSAQPETRAILFSEDGAPPLVLPVVPLVQWAPSSK